MHSQLTSPEALGIVRTIVYANESATQIDDKNREERDGRHENRRKWQQNAAQSQAQQNLG